MIWSALAAVVLAQTGVADRDYAGDWYVSDITNNNTGEREVYAFQTHLRSQDPDYVTLTMRCTKGMPTFYVEWDNISLPDQAVLTIAPVLDPNIDPIEQRYVFEKSEDPVARGMRASSATSAAIVTALGVAKRTVVTAHLTSGSRSVDVEVSGTRLAWDRVSRHCPVKTLPRPPL